MEWREILRASEMPSDEPTLALLTACGTEAPDFGAIGFRALPDGKEPWPPDHGPVNGRFPVRCAPLFTELAGGSGIALEAKSLTDVGTSATAAAHSRIQRAGYPPDLVLKQGALSGQLLLSTPAVLATTELGPGSYIVIASGGLYPRDWNNATSRPTVEVAWTPPLRSTFLGARCSSFPYLDSSRGIDRPQSHAPDLTCTSFARGIAAKSDLPHLPGAWLCASAPSADLVPPMPSRVATL